jgi:DNA-directed RNA polymerase subunit beta
MRINFSKTNSTFPLPDPIKLQKDSFKWFLEKGLAETLNEVSEIHDMTGRGWALSFSNPRVDKPNRTVETAKLMGLNYDAPWYITATIRQVGTKQEKSKEIYMGDMPIMGEDGVFCVNGVSKVVINQLTRSQGVFFSMERDATYGIDLPSAKILPKIGAWIDFEISKQGIINVRIDKKRKFPVTVLLRVFGLETNEDILRAFADDVQDRASSPITKTLSKDPSSNYNEAMIELYKRVRPGEPAVLEAAKALVDNLFFNIKRYSLGDIGRFKINMKFGLDIPIEEKYFTLQKSDLIEMIRYLIHLWQGDEPENYRVDDIDSLSNRRLKPVGELLQSEVRYGFYQLERLAREKMALQPREKLPDPSVLISPRPVSARIISFLSSGQLAQLLDQYNPLDSLDHRRRLSVMGKGGITRERASYEVRDAHPTHFGKIDVIRSPEGQNIGLVTYLALYSRVNKYGFLETPYARVEKTKDGRMHITKDYQYLAVYDEALYNIAGGDVPMDADGYITSDRVPTRRGTEFFIGRAEDVHFIEVSPQQILGISTSLIPFIANNDVARALITAQQSSQAVPLVKPEAPIVGTGNEGYVADSVGLNIRADEDGVIEYADGEKIVLKGKTKTYDYRVTKFKQSNMDSSFSQNTTVKTGQKVSKGDVLAEGPAAREGDLALGVNLKVAFMPYEGFNFEDAFILSDRVVKEDVLTSITITDYMVQVMDTKLGPEDVTSDIPNVSEESLRNLGSDGIVVVGSQVRSGDILVGKIAPKGQSELSAEERLLRAVFGERVQDVKDNSLRLPHGRSGVVVDVRVLTPRDKEQMAKGVLKEVSVKVAEYRPISVGDKLSNRHGQKGVIAKIVPAYDMPMLPDGSPVDVIISPVSILGRMNIGNVLEAHLGWVGLKTGNKYAIPPFAKIDRREIAAELKKSGLPESGKTKLIDGKTGDMYDQEVTVGAIYIYKLHHMAEEKINARATGPYSLITQQPLGGKAQLGGQRFGEMEVWALEAYGTSHILKEMLTIKSDDIKGRYLTFQSIIKDLEIPESHIPESFKLLVRQLNGLGLSINPIIFGNREAITDEDYVDIEGISALAPVGGILDDPIADDDADKKAKDIEPDDLASSLKE